MWQIIWILLKLYTVKNFVSKTDFGAAAATTIRWCNRVPTVGAKVESDLKMVERN